MREVAPRKSFLRDKLSAIRRLTSICFQNVVCFPTYPLSGGRRSMGGMRVYSRKVISGQLQDRAVLKRCFPLEKWGRKAPWLYTHTFVPRGVLADVASYVSAWHP